MYRVDTRPPEEIFAKGFSVPGPGTNSNLLDHVNGRSTLQSSSGLKGTTNFVSTSTSVEYAMNYAGRLRAGGSEGWVYVVQPDRNFYNVRASLERAANNAQPGVAQAAKDTLKYFGSQEEWAALGPIRSEFVQYAVPVKMVNKLPEPDWNRLVSNENYRPGTDTQASSIPYRITRSTEATPPAAGLPPCTPGTGRVRRSAELCEPAARPTGHNVQDEELAQTHRERLASNGSDIEYASSLKELESNPKALLSPLRETNDVVADALGKKLSAQDFEGFSARVSTALSRDLKTVERLSTDTNLLARLGKQAGRAGQFGLKLVPYVGIAASGYAISEDAKAGDYVNLGFDSITEGLQVATAAQPELVVITEPILLTEQLAQYVYNELAGRASEVALLNHDRGVWDKAPQDLRAARDPLWHNHLVEVSKNTVIPSIDKKLGAAFAADKATLDQWAAAQSKALTAVAGKARAAAASQAEKNQVTARERTLRQHLAQEVLDARTRRAEVYQKYAQQIAQHVLDSALRPTDGHQSAFDAFNERFIDKTAKPYLEKLLSRISQEEFKASGARAWNQAELARRRARWKQMTQQKLAEVRQVLSQEGRLTLPAVEINLGLHLNTPRLKP
ncbi:enterotoxin A family protein [Streptomyces sirii]|uniref:enterotoxin A family protein n=1 Tax=Streptomyces sirii TaxID=3127701 RepID=UPI003D35C864